MARYLLLEAPEPPGFGLRRMKDTRTLTIPPGDRPTEQMNDLPIAEWAGISERHPRRVQPEFNEAGDRVRFSVRNPGDKVSARVVVDDKTPDLKKAIRHGRLITPTGKFDVFNTLADTC